MGLVTTNSGTRTGKKENANMLLKCKTIAPRGLIKGRRAEEDESSESAGTKDLHTITVTV